MEMSLRQIIDLDNRNLDVKAEPIPLRRFVVDGLGGPYKTISAPIKPETDEDIKIIRLALLRVPLPPIYVTEEFGDGRLTCVKGARMVGLLLYAMEHGLANNEIAYSRRIGDTDINVVKFRPVTGEAHAKEIINILESYK